MANSKYEYVRSFEQPDTLLANTWIIVRIDGRGFSKFTTKYEFTKPNDRKALDLMNAAAEAVMKELQDLVIAYGNSDEYSFVFHKDCNLFERRASKLTTTIVSTFTSYYVFLWSKYFPEKPLTPPLPSFDGRAVCYPSDLNLRDYMSWRQVDCHINNLYNTTFWTLVQQGGMDARSAEQRLSGTVSSDKNELLFKEFGINYNKEPECFKKGTVLYRDFFPSVSIEALSSPTSSGFPSPSLAQPQPRRPSPASTTIQPLETSTSVLYDRMKEAYIPGEMPGPTFLSASSTPSPPPSPIAPSISADPNQLRAMEVSTRHSTYPPTNALTTSPPSTVTSPYGSLVSQSSKQTYASLMPLVISPLTLKPSTKPPTSLSAPNPTTRINFSPTAPPSDFPSAFQISGYSHKGPSEVTRMASHSASASMSAHASASGPPLSHRNNIKRRSPSQPHLPSYLSLHSKSASEPPSIPLRISSIPVNSRPPKLSLHNDPSYSTLKSVRSATEDGDLPFSNFQTTTGFGALQKQSSSLRTNKELPLPPLSRDEELRTHRKVKSNNNSPEQDSMPMFHAKILPGHLPSKSGTKDGQEFIDRDIAHPGIAELPATSPVVLHRGKGHSRFHSASTSASLSYPHRGPDFVTLPSCMGAKSLANGSSALQSIANTNGSQEKDNLLLAHNRAQVSQAPSSHATSAKTLPETKCNGVKSNTSAPLPKGTRKSSLPTARKPAKSTNHPTQHSSGIDGSDKAPGQNGRSFVTTQPCSSDRPAVMSRRQRDKDRKKRSKAKIITEHIDIIKDEFWEKRPWILTGKAG